MRNSLLKRRARKLFLGCLAPFVILASWEYLGRRGIINLSILPRPSVIMDCLAEMIANGQLKKHLLVSAFRVVKGFLIGGGVGLVLGVLCGLSNTWNDVLSSLIGILRPIPMIAWIPILILLLGIDEGSKIALIAIGTFWPVLLNTSRGIRNTDKKLLEVGIILEKSRSQMLTKVILPAAFPFIFTGIRLGVSSAWSCVVTAEVIAAAVGIGYVIMYARELLQPDVLLIGVLTIGVVGLLLDVVLLQIEKRALRWNEADER
ncbi:MAG: ABC transporter permease [Synergistaceae bacterium]|nr:ABC transporter permease [Synergistaceae bacterium]